MSDTKVSSSEGVRDNIIPGRLKSIVVNNWLTISYAGLSTQAIDVIRKISKTKEITTDIAIDYLSRISTRYLNELDFILCSHEKNARVVKISNGHVSEGANVYWIGNSQVATEVSKEIGQSKGREVDNLPDYMTPEEVRFKGVFSRYMFDNRCHDIGGVPIDCLCSPYGHCYNMGVGLLSNEEVSFAANNHKKDNTGMLRYEYRILNTLVRGQAKLGFYLGQIQLGFIYDPIHYDEAVKFKNINLEDFSRLVNCAGKVIS